MMDAHRIGEERSLEYHRVLAERIRRDPSILMRARARMERDLAAGGHSAPYFRRWIELLGGPLEELLARIVDPGEDMRALRSCSPFAGEIEPRERFRIWREVRERCERLP